MAARLRTPGRLALPAFGPVLLALGALLLAGRPALASSILPMTLEETVRRADAICVGRVLGHHSRWQDASRRFMVTEYLFWVEEAILATDEVRAGVVLSLPFWGGTIGTETHEAAGVPLPVDGERYVMLLRPNWHAVSWTPVVGLHQGMLRVEPQVPGGDESVLTVDGLPLAWTPEGPVLRRDEVAAGMPVPSGVRLHQLRRWLATHLRRIKASVSAHPEPPRLTAVEDESQAPAPAVPMPPTSPRGRGARLAADVSVAAVPLEPAPGSRYRFNPWLQPPTYLLMNPFPPGHAWAGEDVLAMSKWNYYRDIFRYRTDPTPMDDGSRAFGNDSFDLIGLWDDDTLRANTRATYGVEQGWDQSTLAITVYRHYDVLQTVLREADIVFNPSYAIPPKNIVWTLFDEVFHTGQQTVSQRPVRNTLTHELGHVLGFAHQPRTLSIMSYPDVEYRPFSFPYMDDAEGVRQRYPVLSEPSITDLAVYLYSWKSGTEAHQTWGDVTITPQVVRRGGQFTLNNYHVENVGTAAITEPKIEWWLTRGLSFVEPYYFLGTARYPALGRFRYFRNDSLSTTLTVPASVAPGSYHLAAFIREDGGPNQNAFPLSNNFAWSRYRIGVEP